MYVPNNDDIISIIIMYKYIAEPINWNCINMSFTSIVILILEIKLSY
jgi:hypothetical protein